MRNLTTRRRLSIVLVSFTFCFACDDFLATEPYGTTTFEKIATNAGGAETLLIAAYSNLDGVSSADFPFRGAASNWVFGSIVGGDAYKGSDPVDLGMITPIELQSVGPNNIYVEGKWTAYYQGIARANDAIRAFLQLSTAGQEFRNKIAEARFLRGLYHFELYKIFRQVPFIDETIEDVRIGNSENILPKIQDDFLYASIYLPWQQSQPGRITKGAAQSFLGITYMWTPADFAKARIYFDSVISSGIYSLNKEYHQNFNIDFRNTGTESILEVQQSVNDDASGFNGNYGDILNYTYTGGPGRCCGFHQPSQNLVNAFKTNSNGLPMLDDYNTSDVTNDEGIESDEPFTPYAGTLDPRLDWTVGRREIPYFDWGKHPGRQWIRDQPYAGPYSPKKYMYYKSQEESNTDKSSWTGGMPNTNNLKLLRYGDLLLYAAEAEVELGDLPKALQYVNQVRRRAANKAGFVKNEDGSDAANYFINEYPSFPDQAYAKKAVRFERRLELGMEGHRFFDLVRWGVAAEEKTKYYEVEKTKRAYLSGGEFIEGKNEVMPIPQNSIDRSYKNGVRTLQQNPGYNN